MRLKKNPLDRTRIADEQVNYNYSMFKWRYNYQGEAVQEESNGTRNFDFKDEVPWLLTERLENKGKMTKSLRDK